MKTKMTSINLRFLKALVLVDLALIGLSLGLFNVQVLWNTQVGFVSTSLILFASIASYSKMVQVGVDNNVIAYDDTVDVLDQIEDPYDLYTEDIVQEEKALVDVVKEERQKLKASTRSMKKRLKIAEQLYQDID